MAAEGLGDRVRGLDVHHQHDQGGRAGLEHAPGPALELRVDPGPVDLGHGRPKAGANNHSQARADAQADQQSKSIPQMIPTANRYGLVATRMVPSQFRMMARAVSGACSAG